MAKEKMLVTEGLNELKTLDARINRAINKLNPVICTKNSEKNAAPGITKEDFVKEAKATMQSIDDLIKRREKIKTAIIESNSNTFVVICDEYMTVAKAIDLKESIGYKRNLLQKLNAVYAFETAKVNINNSKVADAIDHLVETAYGREGKDKIREEDYNIIAKPYKERNECDLLDPLDTKKRIEELSDYIDEFCATVDSKLQISNCTNTIEIEV